MGCRGVEAQDMVFEIVCKYLKVTYEPGFRKLRPASRRKKRGHKPPRQIPYREIGYRLGMNCANRCIIL